MQIIHLILLLTLALVQFAVGNPNPTSTNTPTRPFTVAAFFSPYPPGAQPNGVSGARLRAIDGKFLVNPGGSQLPNTGCGDLKGKKCPPGNETVLWVDREGKAWLDSKNPQQVYLDTTTGALSYLTSTTKPANTFASGAITVNFLHLGQGTSVITPISGLDPTQYANAGPGSFKWLGSENSYWFLCGSLQGNGYQVMKEVGGLQDWSSCLSGISLVALDYSGVSPAAGEYL